MKNLLITLSFVFIDHFFFSQTIRIEVTETIYLHVIDTIGVDIIDIINNNKEITIQPTPSKVTYEFDLTNKEFKYFHRGVLEDEGEIVFNNLGSLHIINFLIEGYDIGMLINLDVHNEQVVWFSIFGTDKDIYKFTEFQIIKGL